MRKRALKLAYTRPPERVYGEQVGAIAASGTVATQASPRAGSRLGHAVSVNYRGHRTYLDPNPRLVSTRSTVWERPARKGHRQFLDIAGAGK